MKILMLVSSDLDRDPRVQKEARSACREGHDVTVVCRFSSCTQRFRVLAIGAPKTRHGGAVLRLLDRLWFQARCIVAAPKRSEVVHANDLDMLPVGWILARFWGSRLVYDSHESWTDLDRGLPVWMIRLLRSAEGLLARRSDAVITVSEPIASAMAARYGVERPVVLVNAPEYVDVTETLGARAGRQTSRDRGVSTVLFHGRYRTDIGLEHVLRSVPHFRPGIKLALRGFGPAEAGLRRLSCELEVDDRVEFLDPVPMEALVPAACSADVGIIPLLPFTLQNLGASPNKLYEYLMAGLPVASARIPTIEEVISRFGVGATFDIFDPESIASCISDLLEPANLCEMRERALLAARELNWENEYPKLESVYQTLSDR